MAVIPRISGFRDPTLDPFAVWESSVGLTDVEDPHPRLAELRRKAPVHVGQPRELFGLSGYPFWEGKPCYTVLGYDEAMAVLDNWQDYSNAFLADEIAIRFGTRSLHAMDPPEHTRYRRLFQKAFLPGHVAAWRAELLPRVVNHFLDGIARQGRAELMKEFVKPFPFHFIFGQLALPREDQATFHGLAVALLCTMYPDVMAEASGLLGSYLTSLVEIRRHEPGEDLISNLATAEIDGDQLPVEVIVDFLRQLLAAGGGTTLHATGTMLVGLLNAPEQLAAVTRDRSLVPRAVAEALRWDAPSMTATRMTKRPMRLGGVDIPQDARLTIMLGAINRDPSLTGKEDGFDLFRETPDRPASLAFSYGPHICIGRHLAQMEMGVALEAVLDRLPGLRLDPRYPAPRVRGLITRTPDVVHVQFD